MWWWFPPAASNGCSAMATTESSGRRCCRNTSGSIRAFNCSSLWCRRRSWRTRCGGTAAGGWVPISWCCGHRWRMPCSSRVWWSASTISRPGAAARLCWRRMWWGGSPQRQGSQVCRFTTRSPWPASIARWCPDHRPASTSCWPWRPPADRSGWPWIRSASGGVPGPMAPRTPWCRSSPATPGPPPPRHPPTVRPCWPGSHGCVSSPYRAGWTSPVVRGS